MIQQAIRKMIDEGRALTYEEAADAMREIMTGGAGEAQVAGYLTALRLKGETVEEIAASADVMRQVALPCTVTSDSMDIVGTGGDRSCSFNISTCSSFVVAAAGVKVAKHGNRSVSSKCGAADVLTALGANLKVDPAKAGGIMDECNFIFLHAQVYHPAMKYAAPVRSALGVRTLFNILGPLANPARANMQLLGVYSKDMVVPLARVLSRLGTKRVIAVYGCDGLDEVSLSDKTYCCEIIDGKEREYYVSAEDFGLQRADKCDIVGGEPDENARIMRCILQGERGARRDAVLANSAMCLYLAGKADNLKEGALIAGQMLDSGAAYTVFNKFVQATNA